jgi:hypothetical protein
LQGLHGLTSARGRSPALAQSYGKPNRMISEILTISPRIEQASRTDFRETGRRNRCVRRRRLWRCEP